MPRVQPRGERRGGVCWPILKKRWRQRSTGLAKVLNKNPDFVSWLVGEGVRRRLEDPEYAELLDNLDEKLERQKRTS